MKAFCLLILFLAGCASIPEDTAFLDALKTSVFIDAPTSSGSGVVLNDRCILTAAHVTADDDVFKLTTADGTDRIVTKNVTNYYEDAKDDIAVLCAADNLKIAPVTIAQKMPVRYARVFTIGYPLNFHKVLTEGRYQLDSLVTAPVAPGNSGGGVFDANGTYIGFADAHAIYRSNKTVLGYPHLMVIVEIDLIRKFLEDRHIAYTSAS